MASDPSPAKQNRSSEVKQTHKEYAQTDFHWGAYHAEVADGRVTALRPDPLDPNPSPIGQSAPDAVHHPSRIAQPMVRKGWLERGPLHHGGGRGADEFVAVSWDEALDLVAAELRRVKEDYGNEAIFGGSYGWGSAGLLHRPNAQLHRFLNLIGGYVKSVNSYSAAAAEVILPHVLGFGYGAVTGGAYSWPVIAEHTKLVVSFGGMPSKNSQVQHGGVVKHQTHDWLERCAENGVEFVNIGPLRQDAPEFLNAEWLAPRPNTDTALMLGLAHTLFAEGLHDEEFLDTFCVGFDRFRAYLMGERDGQAKDAEWAAAICGLPADTIRNLARRMARTRTLITLGLSLQRADHGEQTYWMSIVLAAMLGQIGLPGGGIGFAYSTFAAVGNPGRSIGAAGIAEGKNGVDAFIPVARISDMLLNPGAPFDYNGQRRTYPDIRLVYWCGGNPFHHHQDLNRLVEAWQRPQTVIVHEPWWNALARHADIVLPATTPLERNDICKESGGFVLVAMQQAVPPVGDARNDHEIFAALGERLGTAAAFTEGCDEEGWLRRIYAGFRRRAKNEGIQLPDFDTFWQAGEVELAAEGDHPVLLADFRRDPAANALPTPSGRIEIFSETIAGFEYEDCPPHPMWLEPLEWSGGVRAEQYPLHMVSHQPATRLHSQYDMGRVSLANKVQGREPMLIHPSDAAARGIEDGSVARVFNDRGECLAGVRISDDVRRGVVVLPTGAWYDPQTPRGLERHGNPNVLTLDKGTSRLAQGSVAHTALVEVEAYTQTPPAVQAFELPAIVAK